MSNLDQLRSSIIQQSDSIGRKRRFGLFSQPVSTAIGDDSPFRTKIPPRDQTGKPATQPRNIYASPLKSGQLRKSYFGQLNSLATHSKHDIFIEEGIRLLNEQNKSFHAGRKQANFVPANGTNRPVVNSAFPYIEQMNPELDPRRFLGEDGRVRSGARNFYTNNNSKVAQTLFKHYKYVADPYQREHDQEVERVRREKAKERQEIFKPNNFASHLLNKDSKVYGSEIQLPNKEQKLKPSPSFKHEVPWRPNGLEKEGRYGMFKPVHPYMQNPPVQRRPTKVESASRQVFKSMNASMLSVPSGSIALNKVNMMKSINRSLSPKR